MGTNVKVADKGGTLVWPRLCVCCMGPAESEIALGNSRRIGTRVITDIWRVPYCKRCIAHDKMSHLSHAWILWMFWALGGLLFGATLLAEAADSYRFHITGYLILTLVFFGPLVLCQWRWNKRRTAARRTMDRNCAGLVNVLEYNGTTARGLHSFHFQNSRYAGEFLHHNPQSEPRAPQPGARSPVDIWMLKLAKVFFALLVLVGGYLLLIRLMRPAPQIEQEGQSQLYNPPSTVVENSPKGSDPRSAYETESRLSYFNSLIERSPKDSLRMRLKSTPTENEIEKHAGPPTERNVEKPGDTPARFLTEANPVTYVSWEDQNSSFFCEFSHKDGRLFSLSINNKLGLSVSDVGRTWGTFHTIH